MYRGRTGQQALTLLQPPQQQGSWMQRTQLLPRQAGVSAQLCQPAATLQVSSNSDAKLYLNMCRRPSRQEGWNVEQTWIQHDCKFSEYVVRVWGSLGEGTTT
jgi:hypothetical protein